MIVIYEINEHLNEIVIKAHFSNSVNAGIFPQKIKTATVNPKLESGKEK